MQKTNSTTFAQFPGDLRALSAELEALRQLLLKYSNEHPEICATSTAESGIIAITRIFPGITLEQWANLAESNGLQDWLALSLDKSSSFNLRHLQQSLEELAHQSEHDPLTGLVNRRAFDRRLLMEAERVERSNGTVCLATIDIDNFKLVNDTYGHACGDKVLCGLADILVETKRVYDVAARLGGEEFALILPGATPLRAKAMVERVLQIFRESQFMCENNTPFSCTFSCGVCSIKGRESINTTQLMELADQALYEAKSQGKNRVIVARQKQEIEYDRSTMVHSNEKQFLFSGIE